MSVRVLLRTVHGMEWCCADEVTSVHSVEHVLLDRREVSLRLPRLNPALLALRTADDIYIEVGRFEGARKTKDAVSPLAARVAGLEWADHVTMLRHVRPVAASPHVDVVVSLEGKRNYNRFTVEQAIGNEVAPLLGGTYLERTPTGRAPGDPCITVRIFMRGSETIAALRVPRRPLHRRAYKGDTGPGTLHPPVAALLARLAGLTSGQSVRDPLCGDGTIPIEVALAHPAVRVLGSDIDPFRLHNAESNAARAGVRLELQRFDAGLAQGLEPVDAIVTNPPWGVAVPGRGSLASSLGPFWHRLPQLLTETGRVVAIADAEQDLVGALRAAGLCTVLAARLRLAGRLSDVVLGAPGNRPPALPEGLARWRDRALTAGVVTAEGF